jgi:hypothetical protein
MLRAVLVRMLREAGCVFSRTWGTGTNVPERGRSV